MDIKGKRELSVDLVHNHMKEANACTKYHCSKGVVHSVSLAAAELLAEPKWRTNAQKSA